MKIKISNEVKVGATALLTIVAFIYLYNYLKGKDLFTSTASYYAYYNDIAGLTESNPVEINGFKAGVVQSINLVNDNSGRILVELSLKKGYNLPEGSVAEITSASLITGMKVRIVFGKGPGIYKDGDTICGRLSEPILSKIETELLPVKDKISRLVDALDSAVSGINEVLTPQFTANIRSTMSNLDRTTGSLNAVLGEKEKDIKSIIEDLSSFSAMLWANSGKMDTTIGNLRAITDSLASADLSGTFLRLKSALEETRDLLSGINEGKGTAGQIVSNDTLYRNLTASLGSLDALLKDMKENPKRYVHFSLFGRK